LHSNISSLISRKNIAAQQCNFSYYEIVSRDERENQTPTHLHHDASPLRTQKHPHKKQHSRMKKSVFLLERSWFSISIRSARERYLSEFENKHF
jgi:hypothetical protein